MLETFHLFLNSREIWQGAVTAGALAGAVCGFLGVYIVLNRMVFVSAAMAQVSSLGVMIAFWITSHQEAVHGHSEDSLALVMAMVFTLGFSLFLARSRSDLQLARVRSSESVIGTAYILSSALVLLLSDRIAQGAHDVSNLLFGNAVIVDAVHLQLLAAMTLPFLAVHIWLMKDVFFVSYDAPTARTMGYPVRSLQLFLLMSLGIVISICTRTIGALPVFAFSTLPAICALALFENVRVVFLVATVLGVLSAVGGYTASFVLSFPTGACMTAFAAAALFVGLLAKSLLRLVKGFAAKV
jgi:zinc transport system permease protein